MAIVLLLHLDVSQSLGNADAQAAFAKDGADAARLHRPMRSGDCLRKWLRTSGKWSGCRGLQRHCGGLQRNAEYRISGHPYFSYLAA